MSKFKKFLSLMLVTATLCLSACSAEQIDESRDSTSTPNESAVELSKDASGWVEELDSINDKYKGKNFNVISCSTGLFFDDSETPIAKEVMNRNALIEQKLDISINCTEKSAEDIEKELRNALKNGKAYADLICAPADVLASLAAEGLLENLYSLPYIDFEAGYINKSELEAQTAKNTMYMMSGLLTMDVGGTVGLFYNKALLESKGVDPYEMVKNNNWTWNELINIATAVSDGSTFGIDSLLSDTETLTSVYTSCGGKLINAGSGNAALAAFDDSIGSYAVSVMNGLFKNGELAGSYAENDAIKAFNEGKLAFLVAKLDNVGRFDESGSEWGLVPLPKQSTAQSSFASPVSGSVMAFAVPKGNEDSGFSGFVLNALLAASTDRLDKALKQTYVNYHFWSNDAALMLELIGDSKCVDLGIVYSGVSEVYGAGVEMLLKNEITPLSVEQVAAFNAFADRTFN